jgi:hypothetical protein
MFFSNCASEKVIPEREPIPRSNLLENPLDIPLNKSAFDSAYKKFKPKIFVRNLSSEERKDTIYKYSKKKTSFIFYKTTKQESFFLTATIKDDQIRLRNGISVGLTRDELASRIKDFPEKDSDTIKINNTNRQMIFIFEQSNLNKIHINNYFEE